MVLVWCNALPSPVWPDFRVSIINPTAVAVFSHEYVVSMSRDELQVWQSDVTLPLASVSPCEQRW